MQGIVIESVAWNAEQVDAASTGEILIGSNTGAIYEARIEPSDEYFKREEKHFKLVNAEIQRLDLPASGQGAHYGTAL